MTEFGEKLVGLIKAHKTMSITVVSIAAVAVMGTIGYKALNKSGDEISEQAEVVDVTITEEEAPELVEVPQFFTVTITGESVEKDLTIYISDANDVCITGTQFAVKLLSKEDAETLQPYLTALQELNAQIEAYTGQTDLDVGGETEVDSSAAADRLKITITDDEGDVVDTIEPSAEEDPLNKLYWDKEVALEAYAMALENTQGETYYDEDGDGVIAESDMTPGDYMACLVYDESWPLVYDPASYVNSVTVKDKIEYKVVEEITKKVSADKESEDGQKKAATAVENKPKDTVKYVESSSTTSNAKSSTNSTSSDTSEKKTYKATTSVKAPDTTATTTEQYEITGTSGTGSYTHTVTTSQASEDSENTDSSESTEETTETEESAAICMYLDGATFSVYTDVSGTNVTVDSITVNGTSVSGSGGTYDITQAGDYELKGTAHFSDSHTEEFSVVYTVEKKETSDTETEAKALYDTDGHVLYLDAEGKTKATEDDYVEGQTYYYEDTSAADKTSSDKTDTDKTSSDKTTSDKTSTTTETEKLTGWQSENGKSYYYDEDGNKVTGTQVIQGVTYNFGTDGALIVEGTGIDVSKYQGNIDWSQAKSSINFAIIRCGYRGMYDGILHEDPNFSTNMSGASAQGIPTGVYIYSTALTEAEAVEEASMAVEMANAAGGCSYPIYMDMEDTVRGVSSLTSEERVAIINAFCETVQSAGYKAGLYASRTWLTDRISVGSITSGVSIWVAQYNTTCSYSGSYALWQYSSTGTVPGIEGSVDMNKSYN